MYLLNNLRKVNAMNWKCKTVFVMKPLFKVNPDTDGDAGGAAVSAQREDNYLAADAAKAADPPPTKRSGQSSSALMSLLGPASTLKQPAALDRHAAEEAEDEVKVCREADSLLLSENQLSWRIKEE